MPRITITTPTGQTHQDVEEHEAQDLFNHAVDSHCEPEERFHVATQREYLGNRTALILYENSISADFVLVHLNMKPR